MGSVIKRIAAVLLSMVFVVNMTLPTVLAEEKQNSEASSVRKMRAEFDVFMDTQFVYGITHDALYLNLALANPEKFEGYYDDDYKEIYWRLEPEKQRDYNEDARLAMQTFKKFERSKLTMAQRKDYDIFALNAALFEEGSKIADHHKPFRYIGNTPLLLSEYQFNNVDDIEIYLELCSQIGALFGDYFSFDREKAVYGMLSVEAIEEAINECKTFLKKTQSNVMVVEFAKRINELTFINSTRKNAYIRQNRKIFTEKIAPAYRELIVELEKLKDLGSENAKSIAEFDTGKAFYRHALKRAGITMTPEELISVSNSKLRSYSREFVDFVSTNDGLGFDVDVVTGGTSAERIMALLRTESSKDFPDIPPNITYEIKKIDGGLTGLSDGVYVLPRIDDYINNVIYYNPDVSYDYLFALMAHEGFPGHLLETVLRYSNDDISNYRKYNTFMGYSEGWATYAELYSYKYLRRNDNMKKLIRLEKELDMALFLRVDLGVNYQGWTLKQLSEYLDTIAFFKDYISDEFYETFYKHALTHPMNPVPYAAGYYEIEILRARFERQLGAAYSDKLFHEEFLKIGTAPFSMVKSWLDHAVREHRKQAA